MKKEKTKYIDVILKQMEKAGLNKYDTFYSTTIRWRSAELESRLNNCLLAIFKQEEVEKLSFQLCHQNLKELQNACLLAEEAVIMNSWASQRKRVYLMNLTALMQT